LQILAARREFEACVEAEMSAVGATGNEDQFRETGIMLREIRVRLDLDYVPFGQRIQSTRELNVGQEVWLAPAKPGTGQWSRASVIAVDEAYLHVAVRDEKLVDDAPGRELRCHFWREDDARYELTLTVTHGEGAPPTISFLHANDLRRVQARDYFRVRYNQETTIGVLSAVSGQDEGQPRRVVTRVRGRISSLSGGGLAVVTQHVLQVARLLRVSIELPNEKPFEVDVNTVAVDSIAGGRYLVRGAFVDIPEEKRDAIAHYVMRRQQPQPGAAETASGPREVRSTERPE
jgi:c-di-GMP-binding flagellar brake protein YcgR